MKYDVRLALDRCQFRRELLVQSVQWFDQRRAVTLVIGAMNRIDLAKHGDDLANHGDRIDRIQPDMRISTRRMIVVVVFVMLAMRIVVVPVRLPGTALSQRQYRDAGRVQ